MKISRHTNGSYSITDMTHRDVSAISLGMSAAAAHPARWSGMTEDDIAFCEQGQDAAARLTSVLWAIERAAGAGSIVVTSSGYCGDGAFFVEKITKIAGYRDKNGEREDLTSHLARKDQ